MGKNKNAAPKAAAPAPKVEIPNSTEQKGATEKKAQTVENENEFLMSMTEEQREQYLQGLDPNHRMDLIKVMHETFRTDPMAPSHTGFSAEAVANINKINAAMQVGALICEIGIAKNPFTMLMPPAMVENIKLIGAEMGVSLKTNLLPAPNKDGNIEVPSAAIVIDPKTKKAAKEEMKVIEEKPELNPQKIKNEEELKKAAIYVLADTKTNARPYNRINAAIDLYYSWLYFQAADDAAKEELKKQSKVVLFDKLTKIIGPCPFSMEGMSKILFNETSKTKSPIPAFCMLRNNSMDSNGNPTIEDNLVAGFVKILIRWNAEGRIAETKESIAVCKDNIEVLSKNKKQNKVAIEKEEQKIKDYEAVIDSYNETVTYVMEPSSHLADVLPEAYDDTKHDDFKAVRRMVQQLFGTYYPGIDLKTVDKECVKHNGQQYIGVVLNFFRDPGSQFQNYTESNIVELKMQEEETKKA